MAKASGETLAANLVVRRGLRRGELDNGQPYFIATDNDPQLIWRLDSWQRRIFKDASAVRVDFRGQARVGSLANPCVFVDWGDGFDADAVTPLRPHDGGWYSHVPARGRQCMAVRFDPSTEACEFTLDSFDVAPVGKLEPLGPVARVGSEAKLLLGPLRLPVVRAWRAARARFRRSDSFLKKVRNRLLGRSPWRDLYDHSFAVARQMRSPHFAAPVATPVAVTPDSPRLIAFYLPQFHPFPENDAWWGKGFTEWTNVSKAVPQFVDHYQPRLPADLGFYDLRLADTLHEQARLAKSAGLAGFCFHYYWFGGKRLLERPLDLLLSRPDIDLPFSLCWANENWTRRWDGEENDLLISQAHSPEDDVAVLDDLARYIRDPRYIRVDGKPLVLIYRADIIPDIAATIRRWRARAREIGIGELHLRATTAFGYSEYAAAGFDGIADFPPHAIRSGEINGCLVLTNANYGGLVYDYPTVADQKITELATIRDPCHAPGVMPGWDNEPRKPGLGNVFHNADPQSYYRWLEAACAHAIGAGGQGLVFINAWNEWAEGAYLEPDRWFGHGYLQATREVMAAYAPKLAPEAGRAFSEGAFSSSRPTLILHLYYSDLIDNFSVRLASLDANLIVTLPDSWPPEALERAKQAFPMAEIIVMPNRGRDILPFIRALRRAHALGADLFCKIHSKKSPHMANGEAWREELLEGLLSETGWRQAVERFAEEADLGLLAMASSRMSLSDPSVMYHNHSSVNRLSTMLGLQGHSDFFPAGSMFWGRASAFTPLLDLEETLLDFEPELGRIDGTTAHALERLMSAIVESHRFRVSYLL